MKYGHCAVRMLEICVIGSEINKCIFGIRDPQFVLYIVQLLVGADDD